MGRPSKVTPVIEETTDTVVQDTVNDAVDVGEVNNSASELIKPYANPPVKEIIKEKAVNYSVTASFKTRTLDGDRITHKYTGAGKSVAEAFTVTGSEEDIADEYERPFPKGINQNVVITVRTSQGYEHTRSVASHVARDIFENGNVALAARLLGV